MKTPLFSLAVALALAAKAYAGPARDHQILVYTNRDGVALQGYDPVAYFTDHQPARGNPNFMSAYQGAKYWFASAQHKAAFDTEPAKHAPAYGGFCGYAASIGKVRPADPLVWTIVDGQLIVQNTKGAAKLWDKDVPANKAKADKYWPLLAEAKAGKKDPIDGLLAKSVLDLQAIK